MSPERRWPWWVSWMLIPTAALGALLLLVFLFSPSPLQRYEEAVAELRAQGFAVTPAELARPEPAAEENGAALLDAAVAKMREIAGSDRSAWTAPGPWRGDLEAGWALTADEATLEQGRAFLAQLAPALADVEAASRRQVIQWPPPASIAAPAPQISTLQTVQQVLSLGIDVGRTPEERLESAACSLRLGRRVHATILIEGVVALAIRAGTITALRPHIECGHVPAVLARAALDAELREPVTPTLGSMARMEIATWTPVYGDDLRGVLPKSTKQMMRASGVTGTLQNTFAKYLMGTPADLLRDLRDAARTPEDSYIRGRVHVEELTGRMRRLSKLHVGWLAQMERNLCRFDATMRLARIALAVTEQRETSGRWPASLDEVRDMFPGGVPLDPFTEAPFEYEVRADGARIASAGHFPDEPKRLESEIVEDGLVWNVLR